MVAAASEQQFDASRPIDLGSANFSDHKFDWYRWMLEESPACMGKVSVLKVSLVTRYDDCRLVLTDERFIRNRGRANGKGADASPLPFPLPKSIALLGRSMIIEDDPQHRRLRNLVNRAFTPRAVGRLSDRVEDLSNELLASLPRQGTFDLIEDYARPVPTRVIAEMMGVDSSSTAMFHKTMSVLSKGMTGFAMLKTMLWDIRQIAKFVRELIELKRNQPGDDILTGLIEAEEEGERLSDDELVAMVFLLIIAGYETTMHSITNGARLLCEHPDQLERLRAEPELWESGVQEIMRHRGPVQGTKLQYPTEDVTFHGHTIKKGTPVMPLLGAANHDPRVFEKPDEFDVARSPNHHLGFGLGMHFCLGRQLALMETRVGLKNLFEQNPNVRIAVDSSKLEIAKMPGWHRHVSLPVSLS